MNTLGVVLLAAATATSGSGGYSKPDVHGLRAFRHHVVAEGAAPASGPVSFAGGQGMDVQAGRRFPNVRSQLSFLDPAGMSISWQSSAGTGGEKVYSPGLTVPGRYNFMQGYIYRLKIENIQGRPGVALYPTLEVAPSTPATDAYLTHNAIPVQFTPEDFDQVVDGGNFVTKVIYLPDPKYQELAIAGVETLVSTRLEPGVDPILEADKRGTILLIVRLGGINLEMSNPGNGAITSVPATESVPLESTAPATAPAPAATPVPNAPAPAPAPAVPAPAVPMPPVPAVAPAPAPAAALDTLPAPALEAPVPVVGEAVPPLPTTPGF
ncbi:MAG: hypothetical protein SFX72_01150 [Isosphaeraceae bacterium]|nr:hypothetical protein [Isosphaeraceae bacterium]